jgi:hypothetical protein
MARRLYAPGSSDLIRSRQRLITGAPFLGHGATRLQSFGTLARQDWRANQGSWTLRPERPDAGIGVFNTNIR